MKVLILAPHIDDIEISAGATVARLIEEGYEIFYVVFSVADVSLPSNYSKGTLRKECLNAAEKLGVNKDNIDILNYRTRQFPNYRQNILEDIYEMRRIKPDLILTTSPNDIHQDHKTISEETLRAFRDVSILGWENVRNFTNFSFDYFMEVSREHLNKKVMAINEYISQKDKPNAYSEDIILSLAKINGFRCGCKYAECFELIREVKRL